MMGETVFQILIVLFQALLYAAALYTAGSLLIIRFLRLPSELEKPLKKSVFSRSLPVTLETTILLIFLKTGYLYDEGFFGMFNLDALSVVAFGPDGQAALVRVIGLTFIIGGAFIRTLPMVELAGVFLLVFSFSLTGHSTGEPRIFLTLLVTLHLLAIAYWVGALHPLLIAVSDPARLEEAAHLAERFGNQALFVVVGLLTIGMVYAATLLGDLSVLGSSPYGQVFLVKLALVSVLLVLAARNKTRIVPALKTGDAMAASSLARAIRLEAICFLAIFIVAASLSSILTLPAS
ncbi:MAG: CopD family protein [Pseudomonadota bacterium]